MGITGLELPPGLEVSVFYTHPALVVVGTRTPRKGF